MNASFDATLAKRLVSQPGVAGYLPILVALILELEKFDKAADPRIDCQSGDEFVVLDDDISSHATERCSFHLREAVRCLLAANNPDQSLGCSIVANIG